MHPVRATSLAYVVLVAVTVATSPLSAAQVPNFSGLSAASPSAPKEANGPSSLAVEEVREALAQSKAQLAAIESTAEPHSEAPSGTSRSEIAERLTLARQRVSIHQQQLDALDRAAQARRSLAETTRARELWRGFPDPPPRSVLLADSLRDEVDAASHAIDQARARIALFQRIDATYSGQVKASQAAARLAIEAAEAARGAPSFTLLDWKRSLAVLRAAVDSDTQVLLQLGARGAKAEVDAAEARHAFAKSKLLDAGSEFTIPPSDLDKAYAELESRRRAIGLELERAVGASAAAINALSLAERRLAGHLAAEAARSQGAGSEAARAAELEREVAARREASVTATQRVYLLRESLLQIDGERAVWEARSRAIGERDPVKARAAHERLVLSLAGVRTSRQYLEQQIDSLARQVREHEARPRDALGGEADAWRRLGEALRSRELDIRRAVDSSQRLERLLSHFRSDFEGRREVSLVERARDAAAGAFLAIRRAWQFELVSIEDTLETAEGRKVAVSRSVTIGRSFGAAAILILGYWLSSFLARLIERRSVALGRATAQSAALVRGWFLFAMAAVLSIIALLSASIPLTAFAFLGGALAIAAGFGLQNVLKNLVSGVMLLVERPIRLGDLVEVDGTRGRITQIGIRASTVRSAEGIESIIPNSRFVEGSVTNWTYSSNTTRQSLAVGVAYGASLRKVNELLADVLARHGLVLKDPAPQVYLEGFADSEVTFELTYWVDLAPVSDIRRVKSDLLHMIDRAFADAGIEMAFPQRDVHLHAAGPLPVEIVRPRVGPS